MRRIEKAYEGCCRDERSNIVSSSCSRCDVNYTLDAFFGRLPSCSVVIFSIVVDFSNYHERLYSGYPSSNNKCIKSFPF